MKEKQTNLENDIQNLLKKGFDIMGKSKYPMMITLKLWKVLVEEFEKV